MRKAFDVFIKNKNCDDDNDPDGYGAREGYDIALEYLDLKAPEQPHINTNGQILIPPQFDDTLDFSDGLAVLRINRKYGYTNNVGKVAIPPQYYNASGFSEGFARVRFQEKGKWGFIDKTGKIVIEPKFDDVSGFRQGTARVTIDNKFGYIDKNGKFIWNPTN